MRLTPLFTAAMLTLAVLIVAPKAHAADTGCKDMTGLSPLEGAQFDNCLTRNFAEYVVVTGKNAQWDGRRATGESTVAVEGKLERILYVIRSPGISSDEVIHNYNKTLTANGFRFLYQTRNDDVTWLHMIWDGQIRLGLTQEGYSSAVKEDTDGKTYVAFWIGNGDPNETIVALDVVTVGKPKNRITAVTVPKARAAADTACTEIAGLKHFDGSAMDYCLTRNFAEYVVVTGKSAGWEGRHPEGQSTEPVEGRLQRRLYVIKSPGISSDEVIHDYRNDLTSLGFRFLYQTRDSDVTWLHMIWEGHIPLGLTQEGYSSAVKEDADGKTYVTFWIGNGARDETIVALDVVTVGKIKDRLTTADTTKDTAATVPEHRGWSETVSAAEISKDLDTSGRIALYGIHFDVDRDSINPDSRATIQEMVKVLAAHPQLHLIVVGHTDSQGLEPHNLDLSSRRADAVIRSLVQAGIASDRLLAHGAGSSQPVATNDTEEGRALNRRVELVKQ
ncbi:MAG: OmpA family protein [Alphaproteobacteria bacterium]|nr:OmpA family protein [Alphaproteobacteria bacterium]